MASKHTDRFFKTFLAIGFLCVFAGLAILLTLPVKKAEGFAGIFFLALLFVSIATIYMSLVLQKGLLLYFGLNLCIFSIGAMIVSANYGAFDQVKLWPLLMISFGFTLVPSGYLRFKKMRTIYVIPASVLVVLGVFFSLFAFNIIKIPFRVFIAYMWPVILILAGLVLVGYYLYCLYNKDEFIKEQEVSDSEEMDSFESGEE